MRDLFDGQNVSNRAWFLLAAVLLVARIAIAAHLPLLGDEAFYWQESRALAPSYSDVPPMTAWLIALGTSIGGDTLLGIRWPFLLLGAALPWLLRYWALSRLQSERDANLVAVSATLLPLIGTGGVLALPDVPLTVLMLAAFVVLDRAADRWYWRDGGMLGICVALALLTHWRAALLVMVGLLWLLLSRRGRSSWRQPAWWLAVWVAVVGFLPVLWFNATHQWSALHFQLIERNPWSFQSAGLWIGIEQFLVLTPLLAVVWVAAWRSAWRQRAAAPFDLSWIGAAGIVGFYLVVGLFADNERTRIHWPQPGYLPVLLAVPALLREWRSGPAWQRFVARYCLAAAACATALLLGLAAFTASPNPAQQQFASSVLGEGFMGWAQVTRETRRLAAALPDDAVIVADNFLLGAQLEFALSDSPRPVYVLDHPRNVRHGRQPQLAIWRRDEIHLLASTWSRGLLVVEVTARAPVEWLDAWQSLCGRFGSLRWLHEERIAGSESSFLYAGISPKQAGLQPDCQTPVMARLDFPTADQPVWRQQPLRVQGWAIADDFGIAAVEVWLDGRPIGTAEMHLPSPHVHEQWPQSRDPDHPNVGFHLDVDLADSAPGRHRVEVDVRSRDRSALVRRFGPVWVQVD
jgi:4-amino-4-deoxy-L-arabinose transferase-like glycosyltransferase